MDSWTAVGTVRHSFADDEVSDDGQEWESEGVDRLNVGTLGYSLRQNKGQESVCVCVVFSFLFQKL